MCPASISELSPLQRAIVLTAAYSDLFDYPLTRNEMRRFLTLPDPGDQEFEAALTGMAPDHLVEVEEFLTLPGRAEIVDVRRQRAQDGARRWDRAGRYGRWLRHVPFVRMVAVCGSQAAGNPRPDADIDFFIITAEGRLWTVQVWAMLLRRLASAFTVPVCPNYFLTLGSLEVAPRDLYHAREVAQAVPLWGGDAYNRFREANRWIDDLLPNLSYADDRRARLATTAPSPIARAFEWLLAGAVGTTLDRAIHGLLLRYYALRLKNRGWQDDQLRRAYRNDRQEVMRGGYGPVVEDAFCARARQQLPNETIAAELARLFPAGDTEQSADGLYARQFVDRYGAAQ